MGCTCIGLISCAEMSTNKTNKIKINSNGRPRLCYLLFSNIKLLFLIANINKLHISAHPNNLVFIIGYGRPYKLLRTMFQNLITRIRKTGIRKRPEHNTIYVTDKAQIR